MEPQTSAKMQMVTRFRPSVKQAADGKG